MSKEARPLEEKNIEEQRRSLQFEGLEQQIEKLRPEIEALTHDIKRLEEIKGTVYVKKILGKVVVPALKGLAAFGGGGLLVSMAPGVGTTLLVGLLGYFSLAEAVIDERAYGFQAAKKDATDTISGIDNEKFHLQREMDSKLEDLRHALTVARAITTRELIEGGATREVVESDDGSKHKELRATEEQIERAREEMNEAFEENKEA
ncbi:MAG: hypothetical protein A3D65_03855 [Candidatus Lloydbacteria bacterium RIFCSPHIGHO2_02_FULL_50_13]|uniref:Uncharacterized protein n=1 Tax=Candidatus Lloydbacteria bacterium RIFCSPHIGHO2_02_FULL_50_13 TaxID=1798661 RepID=A0A1G2D3V2_9BACT|nr:MAG: hypothetical protein A3D65_03855 [Candidatus Lloydbacteria bacterium RIFCSPHIGHO2_02_FULL_50_13]